ncbi:hypothetical protein DM01DRAFT_1407093 [Hesseltinella vesiculosa]|uniref:RING-CH-type domain-containing protein n=1 Tax=Hesseltinella vesiculosa TaxID=101127 RepID=A0A1X2GJ63_9FUNG|nr:hypothetical protein DM01DRAFT_1407093 [Hesseltinella vesiculosa]
MSGPDMDDALPTICKICLEKDDLDALISPCKCSGSIKYVHPGCMRSWRLSLLQVGREKDLYRCTLCQHKLSIKQYSHLRALFNYKGMRILGTVLILVLLLIPVGKFKANTHAQHGHVFLIFLFFPLLPGWVMKLVIYFVAIVVHDPKGGAYGAFSRGELLPFFLNTLKQAIQVNTSSMPSSLDSLVNFEPFPICSSTFSQPITPSMFQKSTTHSPWVNSIIQSLSIHSMVPGHFLYALLFPLADDRMWHWLLCRFSHIHLGFFLLGSVANVWYTHHILSDMFDFLFMSEHDAAPFEPQQTPPPSPGPNHLIATNFLLSVPHRLTSLVRSFQRQCVRFLKQLLVTYCCMLVILFWVHFNLLAFVVMINTNSAQATPPHASQVYASTSALLDHRQQLTNEFLLELPLWVLRWVTLGVAVTSLMSKAIYPWLTHWTSCIDHEIVLSLPSTSS